jgi:hypothetical protein
MHRNYDFKVPRVVGAVFWTLFGLLIALIPAVVAVVSAEFVFHLTQTGGPMVSKAPDGLHFLFITIPALLIFIITSRSFPRWPALLANCLFATFVSWRAWRFHLYAAHHYRDGARSYSAFEWTTFLAVVIIALAWFSYSRSSTARARYAQERNV